MTPEERRLITDLFDRMRSFGVPEKDREAEALINGAVRAMPDAPYMLVQSVLVQEQALQAANARVEELEARMRELERGAQTRAQGSGSFLGGLFGGQAPSSAARPSSVPQAGARATPSGYGGEQPWSQGAQPQQPAPQPAAGGGFMRSALATAAGVAGGMLVADSIRNMLGGGQAHAAQSAGEAHAGSALAGPESREDNERGYSEKTGYVEETDNDPGSDDSGDWGGGDVEI